MIKNVLITSLSAMTLLLSACGENGEGESRLGVQQMLDKGDFTGVISKVEATAKSDDDYLNLASAYMGKAGFTLTDVVSAFAESDSFGEGEALANYTKTIIGEEPSPTAFSDLEKANLYFTKVVSNGCFSNQSYLSSSQKDVCLYMGLALTTKAATTIDLLTDNLENFANDAKIDGKLQASACAMQYVIDPARVDSACTITSKSDVTFIESEKTYGQITVYASGESNDFLLTADKKATILTTGYCPNDDFSKRQSDEKFGYFPCPLNESRGSEDVTTSGVLVSSLNDGIGIVKSVAPQEIKDTVDEFKCELIGGNYNGYSCSKNGAITEQVVIDYLIENN